ncbi:Phosphatidate cytidylyltransferase 1 [Porphyridium purpureum]|uniref:Phosphatidate cytidylyltransferase n=1 Tax=Porphyridium purpureum TaxID=35688 RepID=A0A5J4Z1X4_PORPP|nr:Phosphatidate cytidylyltransferase 1 [Porphyridium purpureum]|eukprot:POR3442..scf208_2
MAKEPVLGVQGRAGDDVSSASSAPAPQTDIAPEKEAKIAAKKKSDFVLRTGLSFVMMAFVLGVIWCGHVAVCIFVVMCEFFIFKEILDLSYAAAKEQPGRKVPHFRLTNWGFFATAIFFIYGKSVMAHFADGNAFFMETPVAAYMMRHHTFLAFCMYVMCFLGFVMSLETGSYMFQFGAFARTHITIFIVVLQANFMILNIKSGMIWFLLPFILVIVNDSFAYFVGRAIGKTPLVTLSPKKTVEGFIGGAVFTLLAAVFFAWLLSKFEFMYCPKPDFTDCGLFCRATCDKPSLFVSQPVALPPNVLRIFSDLFGPKFSIRLAPVQLHALALSLFASIVAPFGGFFASGLKRAFGVKDFANLIPGHGGMTDRMDCQFLMAMFTYVYTINFVHEMSPDVAKILSLLIDLSVSEQQELLVALLEILKRKGVDVASVVTEQLSTAAEAAVDALD